MSALKKTDLTVIEGDARVSDILLAERLGYERPRVVRELIERNADELAEYETVSTLEGYSPLAVRRGKSRGQHFTEYLLNEEQALLVCMLSKTDKARAVRKEVITVFMAWRRGETLPAPRDPFEAWRDRAEMLASTVQALESARGGSVISLNTAPIWKNGKRPYWWSDMEVREFLTITHRQMGTLEAYAAGVAKFGEERMPKKSSIHTFWQRLDGLFSGGAR